MWMAAMLLRCISSWSQREAVCLENASNGTSPSFWLTKMGTLWADMHQPAPRWALRWQFSINCLLLHAHFLHEHWYSPGWCGFCRMTFRSFWRPRALTEDHNTPVVCFFATAYSSVGIWHCYDLPVILARLIVVVLSVQKRWIKSNFLSFTKFIKKPYRYLYLQICLL